MHVCRQHSTWVLMHFRMLETRTCTTGEGERVCACISRYITTHTTHNHIPNGETQGTYTSLENKYSLFENIYIYIYLRYETDCNPSTWGLEREGSQVLTAVPYLVRPCLKKTRGKKTNLPRCVLEGNNAEEVESQLGTSSCLFMG
jgi:hypothetical protein